MHVAPRISQFKQRGDTIVEVLIAIAVISLILGGAYVTTNTSLRATRSAQERGNALKLVESQLEQLKGIIDANPNAVFGTSPAPPSPFCVFNNAVVAPTTGNCTLNTSGAPTTTDPKFNLAITRTGNSFVIRNTWVDVGGNQNAETQITYRAYQ
jgi:prepilin-type N-terminal cleavage/methylation domain-containing protein